MKMVQAEHLVFEYDKRDDEGNVVGTHRAINKVDLEVETGDFIAILGHNGSGKSTLAKHINAILLPNEGTVWVNGMDTKNPENLWDVRQSAGMVFQNPDNQIIGTVVEEDVGFGPENLGVPTDEIWKRVEKSLSAVGMLEYRYHSPNKLSGGQKQRIAIAGVVAMEPKCIVLDEPTAMLDPKGRKAVLKTIEELRKKEKVTVILITHYMEEVTGADKVIIMDQGQIVMQGTPEEIFSEVALLKKYRLDVPQVTTLAYELQQRKFSLPNGIIHMETLLEKLVSCKRKAHIEPLKEKAIEEAPKAQKKEVILELLSLNYTYSPRTAYEKHALKDVTLQISKGEFLGIIGHTGSGKSTLIQQLNGLIKATSGDLLYEGESIYKEKYDFKKLRSQVGLVFQYPEHQLFEVDVLTDVCFGPKNQGLSKEESVERAKKALKLVGISKEYYNQSPFELSGGQKRRVAIAGVLAMNPKVLVLDEPTAGLDPKGRDEILDQIAFLHKSGDMTVILVSHSMEDIARYVERIVVMGHSKVLYDDIPINVFSHYKELEKEGLAAPQVTYIMHALKEKGIPVRTDVTTVWEAADEIARILEIE